MLGMIEVCILYSMRLSGLEYSLLMTLWTFRSTISTFISPYFIKRFSYKQLKLFSRFMDIISCSLCIAAFTLKGDNVVLCGIVLYIIMWLKDFITWPVHVAQNDMHVRLFDYQMYLSGERLESFTNIFGWFVGPITTLVGLIIPLLLLKNGFNSNWDILFLDSSRFNILVVPLIFDLVGHVLMIIPYLFWDYNREQHEYVMDVLKQRAELAEEGVYPDEYDGSLDFAKPEKTSVGIPTDIAAMYRERETQELPGTQA